MHLVKWTVQLVKCIAHGTKIQYKKKNIIEMINFIIGKQGIGSGNQTVYLVDFTVFNLGQNLPVRGFLINLNRKFYT